MGEIQLGSTPPLEADVMKVFLSLQENIIYKKESPARLSFRAL